MKQLRNKYAARTVSRRNSIFTRVFCLVLLLIAFEVFCYVGFNAALLEKYYIGQKKNMLDKVYTAAAALYADSALDASERGVRLEKLSNDSNLQMTVFDSEGKLLFSTVPTDAIRFSGSSSAPPPMRQDGRQSPEIVDENNSRTIAMSYIPELDARILRLDGSLSDGTKILLQAPMSSIREGVRISSRFLLWSGGVASVLAALVGVLISRRATRNVRRLSEISNRMAELDFSVKYDDEGSDEISVLGQSLNTLSAKLEKAVSELKKANIELTRDIDKKEKIDLQRREFLSNVSHELKTPISIIEAYAEGLSEMQLDEDGRRFYSDVILDESKKMEMIIQKLMSLMKIESGSESLMLERYNLAEQLDHIIGQKKILFEQSGVFVEFSCEKPFFVWADEFLIEEAFVNFLVNAVKYCGGERRVKVFLTENDSRVRLSVFNTGDHISEEDSESIWKSFYVLDKARTRENGGCGLGLSIVAAIAEAHGQKYGTYNTDGGVVFWLEVDKG